MNNEVFEMVEMKKNFKYYGNIFIFTAVLMLIVNAVIPATLAAAPGNPAQPAGDNQRVPILITFKAAATAADIDDSIRTSGGDKGRMFGPIRTQEIFVSSNAKDSVLAAFANRPSVERVEAAVKRKIAGIPDDPSYAQQWALPKIAWDQAYGTISISGSSKIAVLDTGVDGSHPDLTARMIAGNSTIGGDQNTDPNGHGTALAGIAAAGVNNAAGMAGVAYSDTKIMPVQVLQADGTGYDSDVIAGVLWALQITAQMSYLWASAARITQQLWQMPLRMHRAGAL